MAMQNGIAVSYGVNAFSINHPKGVQGFNIAYTMQPNSWTFKQWDFLINLSAGHWTTNDYTTNSSINSYAIAPVARWFFMQNTNIAPFLQASIGGAYMSNQHFGGRNLGSHLLFQDQIGAGLAFGAKHSLYATLQFLHYSNAHLANPNDGITIPLLFTVGYQF